MVQYPRLASDLGGDRRARAQSMSDCHRLAIQRRHLDADVVDGRGAGLTKTLVLSGTTVQEHPTGAALQTNVAVPSLAALVGGHRQ
jgi:hypothetical protein